MNTKQYIYIYIYITTQAETRRNFRRRVRLRGLGSHLWLMGMCRLLLFLPLRLSLILIPLLLKHLLRRLLIRLRVICPSSFGRRLHVLGGEATQRAPSPRNQHVCYTPPCWLRSRGPLKSDSSGPILVRRANSPAELRQHQCRHRNRSSWSPQRPMSLRTRSTSSYGYAIPVAELQRQALQLQSRSEN